MIKVCTGATSNSLLQTCRRASPGAWCRWYDPWDPPSLSPGSSHMAHQPPPHPSPPPPTPPQTLNEWNKGWLIEKSEDRFQERSSATHSTFPCIHQDSPGLTRTLDTRGLDRTSLRNQD
uniref:Uncharacterized protein n=1 Tax=Knipowitschia caucasica TaxID=637954 RepID=A0AAV2LDS9_KNICA